MQICKKIVFLYKNYVRDYFNFFLNLIYQKFIENTSFSFTTFYLPKVKSF